MDAELSRPGAGEPEDASGPEPLRPIVTEDGSPTLHSEEYGEPYHNLSGAWLEAQVRYVVPCRIVDRALRGPVRILDIGFGLGWNLAWAWRAVREAAPRTELRITSLEKAPIPPATWLELARRFPDPTIVRGVRKLLEEREFRDGPIHLKLTVGEADETIDGVEEGIDAVFLDPFSPDRNPELWTPRFLAAVRRKVSGGAILSTYSAAVRVRVALLRAGWRPGAGPRVGRKSSGTLASVGEIDPPLPQLPPRELRRLERKARESDHDGPDDANR